MEIGPVDGIRPIPSVRPSPPGFGNSSEPSIDLTGVFATELLDQQRDDSYSPSQDASRGLEDEEPADDSAEPESTSEPDTTGSISFFA